MPIITVEENGIHSLAKSLEAFQKFHTGKGQDKYALKETILYAYQGAETISKAILFRINPVLIIRQTGKKLEEAIPYLMEIYTDSSWSFETIDLTLALDRLSKIFLKHAVFDARDYKRIYDASDELKTCRNALQHFHFSGDEHQIALVIGSFLPGFIKLIEDISKSPIFINAYANGISRYPTQYTRSNPLFVILQQMNSINPDCQKTLLLLQSEYDKSYRQAIQDLSTFSLVDVPQSFKLHYHSIPGAHCEIECKGLINLYIDSIKAVQFSHKFIPPPMFSYNEYEKESEIQSHNCSAYISNHKIEMLGPNAYHYPQESEKHIIDVTIETETTIRNVVNYFNIGEKGDLLRFIDRGILKIRANIQFLGISLPNQVDRLSVEELNDISLEIEINFVPRGVLLGDAKNHIHIIISLTKKEIDITKFQLHFMRDIDINTLSLDLSGKFPINLNLKTTTQPTPPHSL